MANARHRPKAPPKFTLRVTSRDHLRYRGVVEPIAAHVRGKNLVQLRDDALRQLRAAGYHLDDEGLDIAFLDDEVSDVVSKAAELAEVRRSYLEHAKLMRAHARVLTRAGFSRRDAGLLLGVTGAFVQEALDEVEEDDEDNDD